MSEKVTFMRDKVKLVGIINGSKNGSIVILCHGYGSNKDTDKYQLIEEVFAKADIATFRFDFHGCGESGDKFDLNLVKALRYNVKDLGAAMNFLEKNYSIDRIYTN